MERPRPEAAGSNTDEREPVATESAQVRSQGSGRRSLRRDFWLPCVDEELALKAAGDDGKEWDLFRPQDFEWGNIFGPEEESMSDVSGSEASTADDSSLAALNLSKESSK